MGSYNKVLLMGNLTRDIEVRHLPSGQAVGNMGLAVNRKWRDQTSGEMREEVTFIDCEAWGKTAENMARFFSKGRAVFIEGRLKLDTWQDKTDGSNRSKLKVVVESFEFVDSGKGEGGGGGGGGAGGGGNVVTRAPARGRPAPANQNDYSGGNGGGGGGGGGAIDEDDIPF